MATDDVKATILVDGLTSGGAPYEIIAVGDHEIQLGGAEGDGFCYLHSSFDCLENLTTKQAEALRNA